MVDDLKGWAHSSLLALLWARRARTPSTRKHRGVTDTAAAADLENAGRIFAEPSAYADPVAWHATAARLRAEAPISKVVLPDYREFWAITKHADVMEIERNSEIFTNAPTPALAPRKDMEANEGQAAAMKTLVQMDGEEHRDHRALVNDWFKPGNVKKMSDRVDELAKHYVDVMAGMGGRCDFANDVAMHSRSR
jgi:cytochrome P450